MNYQSYTKSKDTPNRKNRKSARRTVFQFNRKVKKLSRRSRSIAVVRN